MAQDEGPGGRISQALRAADLKPAELARRMKVSQPTVHGWVNHHHGITWANARRVAAVLNVAPGWIMFGADTEAERVAQTGEELALLRLYRELEDADQVSFLRLLQRTLSPGGPLLGEFIDSPDELAWVAFWRSLSIDERALVVKMLRIRGDAVSAA
jgi:transcriptional regulator with XRE-family HTH domain